MLLLLDATTKSIEATSSSGATDIVFVTSYADSTSSTFTEGASDGVVSTTDTTIVAAPSASTRRVIKSINFYNTAASSRTVTLKYNNNGTKRTVAVFTLTAGENWSTDDLAGGGGGISSLTVGTTPITGTNGSVLYVNGSVLGEIATTGTGNIVRASSPTLTTPNLGTPSAATLTNATGLPLSTGVTGTLPVVNGGTGASSLALNNVLLGNSTSALQVVAPGISGNVLTSNGTTWTSAAPASGGGSNSICDGRLTLASGTPVATADQTAKTTLYYTPYVGDKIALYSGSAWSVSSFTQLSIPVPATTDTNYDVFVYDSSGAATLELTAWTNNTTRATSLTAQDGVLVKSGAITRRYVGTIRTTGVSGQCEDSASKRFCWNYYNRVVRGLRRQETASSWTYNSATWRQANANTANQVEIVCGYSEDEMQVNVLTSSTGSGYAFVQVAEDSTSSPTTSGYYQGGGGASGNEWFVFSAALSLVPSVGYHYYAWIERTNSVQVTFWGGTGSNSYRGGLFGSIRG